jgi:cell division septum initiation protein DivIVA
MGVHRKVAAYLLAALSFSPISAFAQESADLLARMKAMEDRIKSLEAEIQELKGQQAATTAALTAATPAPPPSPPAMAQVAAAQTQPALGGAGPAAAKVLNPDIAVIGDFLGAAGNSAGRPTPALEMHETEAAF